jgi:hypothetical protein
MRRAQQAAACRIGEAKAPTHALTSFAGVNSYSRIVNM